jgi:antitoxin (DNA-binding transcriptional repressor) of toxin-antitoxin stability system
MALLNARELHNETSAVLDELARGKSFEIARNGKIIGTLQPAKNAEPPDWSEIMAEVWASQKKALGKTRNPVLAEREPTTDTGFNRRQRR